VANAIEFAAGVERRGLGATRVPARESVQLVA